MHNLANTVQFDYGQESVILNLHTICHLAQVLPLHDPLWKCQFMKTSVVLLKMVEINKKMEAIMNKTEERIDASYRVVKSLVIISCYQYRHHRGNLSEELKNDKDIAHAAFQNMTYYDSSHVNYQLKCKESYSTAHGTFHDKARQNQGAL